MEENTGIFSKVSRWVKRQFRREDDLPLLYGQTETSLSPRRGLFGVSWTRAGAELTTVETRLSAVTALMVSLRNAIDQQSQRHDELLTYLSQLSHALQAIPDTSRVQSETLRVLHQQIAYQNAQHKQLSEMIRKMGETGGHQHEILEHLRDRVESLYSTDQNINQMIEQMDGAMKVVNQNSQTSTMVLERLRDNLVTRDGDLEKSIRQGNRHLLIALICTGAIAITALFIAAIVMFGNIRAMEQLKAVPTPPSAVPLTIPESTIVIPNTPTVAEPLPSTPPAGSAIIPATKPTTQTALPMSDTPASAVIPLRPVIEPTTIPANRPVIAPSRHNPAELMDKP